MWNIAANTFEGPKQASTPSRQHGGVEPIAEYIDEIHQRIIKAPFEVVHVFRIAVCIFIVNTVCYVRPST